MSSNSIYKSPLCSCIICHKECSSKGIHSHHRASHTEEGKKRIHELAKIANVNALKSLEEKARLLRVEYYHNPNLCSRCNNTLEYDARKSKFCSHSCAAKVNNIGRPSYGHQISVGMNNKYETHQKTFVGPTLTLEQKRIIFYQNFVGPMRRVQKRVQRKEKIKFEILGEYEKVFFPRCKDCCNLFTSKSFLLICSSCIQTRNNNKFRYSFKFNVYDYPDLFDISLLNSVGFYAPGGKSGRWNKTGLSRDHKVSISDARKYDYDNYYISHPLNCELMPHSSNSKKSSSSSMTYEELVFKVNNYNGGSRTESNLMPKGRSFTGS